MNFRAIVLSAFLSAVFGTFFAKAAELHTIDQSHNYAVAFSSGFATGTIFNITGIGRSWAIFTVGPSSATVEIGVTTMTFSNIPGKTSSQMAPAYSTFTFVVPGNSFLADDMVFNAINPTVGVAALGAGTTYFLYTTYGTPKRVANLDNLSRP